MLRHCTRLASHIGRRCLEPRVRCSAPQSATTPLQQSISTSFNRLHIRAASSSTSTNDATAAQQQTAESTTDAATTTTTGGDILPTTLPDPAAERRLRILQLEVDVLRQEGRKVPARMKPDHWLHLLELQSKSARSKYYTFLWQVEHKRANEKLRRAERREAGVELRETERREREANPHIVYALSGTTYLLRIYETTMNLWHNNKLTRAMQFAPQLVLDCSYDEHMTKRECVHAAKQLMFCFAENREHAQPFDLHFCNADLRGPTMTHLRKHIPTLLDAAFPLHVHEDSYLEHFEREQLVYLTPHCKTDLVEYNPEHVYIVGAMVDTMHNEPLSLAKAKKLGLKMARLPLDRYLHWGSGSGKSLTLNQMVHIMLDLKETGDWRRSLTHVPRRKLVAEEGGQQAERQRWTRDLERVKMGAPAPRQRQNSWTSEAEPKTETQTVDGGVRVNKFRRKSSSDQ